MATIYVDSNATGANDGTSFADAFTSISSVTWAIDDIILVASNHSESLVGGQAWGAGVDDAGWTFVISANSSTEVFESGASITGDDTLDAANIWFIGMTLDFTFFDTTNANRGVFFESCVATFARVLGVVTGKFEAVNTAFTFDTGGPSFADLGQDVKIVGGSISSTLNVGTLLGFGATSNATVHFIGVDMSGLTISDWVNSVNETRKYGRTVRIIGCSAPSVITPGQTGRAEIELEIINTVVGTITTPAFGSGFHDRRTDCITDDTRYRVGGASDGSRNYSFQLTAIADETLKSLVGAKTFRQGLSVRVNPGDTNLRIHLAHDAVGSGTAGALQNNECWAVYQGPSQLGSATAQLHLINTVSGFGVTPADHPTDTVTWVGSGVGTRQYIDIAISPTIAGYAHVLVHYAPENVADRTIHVCPKIEVS